MPAAPATGAASLLQRVVASVIVAVMGVVFAISFAAIIYGGSAAPGLSGGMLLSLAGASVMAVVGVFTLTYRDTIVQPQDVTAIILSLAVADIAHGWQGTPEALLATVVAFVGATTALTGGLAWLCGRFRLGFLVRFVPYPLIGGFLAATGYLVVLGAIGMTLHTSVGIWTLAPLFEPANLPLWLPWLVAGGILWLFHQRFRHDLILPVGIVVLLAGFYLTLGVLGIDLAGARAGGLLLGPFPESGFLGGLDPAAFAGIDWRELILNLPTMLAAAGMAIIGSLLNISALEIATGREIDTDLELRGIGTANLAAAPFGGMIGYQILSETVFARALGLRGALPGLLVAAAGAATLFFGAGVLSLLPIGIFAAILAFLGLDLLNTWLRVERRHLPGRDFGVVLVILATAATVGFLQALAVGLAAAVGLFVVAYSKVEVVRLRTSAAHLRSRVERPQNELRLLAERGGQALVYRLSGYLFFGTASRLLAEIRRAPMAAADGPRFEVLDFHRVSGVDASAAFLLGKLCRDRAASGIGLILCDVSPWLLADLRRAGVPTDDGGGPLVLPTLDAALSHVEDRLLAAPPGAPAGRTDGLIETLARLHPEFDAGRHFPVVTAAAGEEILTQGAPPDGMIVLLSGSLRAEFVTPEGAPVPVATILPGTLVGEIGHYAGVPRTARVTAEVPCSLLRLDGSALDALAASAPEVAIDLHRLAAANLAHRLMRTTALLRDADV